MSVHDSSKAQIVKDVNLCIPRVFLYKMGALANWALSWYVLV